MTEATRRTTGSTRRRSAHGWRRTWPARPGPFTYERIAGGRSNLTYRVNATRAVTRGRCGGRRSARRSVRPTTWAASTASSRRWRGRRSRSADRRLLHRRVRQRAPFYVMEIHLDGADPQAREDAASSASADRRARSASASSSPLVEIHAQVPTRSTSATSARRRTTSPASSAAGASSGRDRRRERSRSSNASHDRLAKRIPDQGPATLVHGDYRLDNMILTPKATWPPSSTGSSAPLGDPLADVGLLLVYWAEEGRRLLLPLFEPATVGPASRPRDEVRPLRGAHRPRPPKMTSSSPSATGSWRSSSRASTPATRRASTASPRTASRSSARTSAGSPRRPTRTWTDWVEARRPFARALGELRQSAPAFGLTRTWRPSGRRYRWHRPKRP